jgi:regulator of extracellular matrix RemA (YlzA/DUF370 family)
MLLSIGYDNFLETRFIVDILGPDSTSAKRLWRDATLNATLINATNGRKARSLILLKTDHIVLCALQAETLRTRLAELRLEV